MKLKNPKEKGPRLERKVAARIRQIGLDPDAQRMARSGAFPHLKGDIYTNLPIHAECKWHEKIRLWEWWDETQSRSTLNKTPVLFITSNNRPIMAIVNYEYLLNLMLIEKQYLEDKCG